jgi:hypothetical protein
MKTLRTPALPFLSLVWTAVASLAPVLAACASDGEKPTGGTGGAAGSGALGGKGGTSGSTAGVGASGGSAGSSGGAGGAGAGRGGSGGAGSGGGSGTSGGAGSGGTSGGSDGGSGGTSGGEAGAAGDNGSGGSSGSGGTDGGMSGSSGNGGNGGSAGGNGGGTIDTCFEGLRPLEGSWQISTRENAGEQIRLRVALETADRGGTSGTYAWGPVRVALEIDGTLICLDEAALAGTYTGSRHNCDDMFSFDYDGKTYEIVPPSSRGVEAATLTVSSNGSVVRGPITLDGVECAGGGVSTDCRSGGPC